MRQYRARLFGTFLAIPGGSHSARPDVNEMTEFFRRPPVIIIGMHRSGTGMVTSMLENLGLFAGAQQDANHEALLFQGINAWVLRQCGGAWDHPAPIRHLFESDEVMALTVDYMRYLLKTPRAASYLGLGKYLAGLARFTSDIRWGWKDPCNTFTLPLWLRIFPDARVVHIRRHGIDVAQSLLFRQRMLLARYKQVYPRRKALYWLRPKRGGFTDSLRCASIQGAFGLWEEYLCQAQRQRVGLADRWLELKYEDFLDSPAKKIAALGAFCELAPSAARIAEIAASVDPSRISAHTKQRALDEFASVMKYRLALHGY